jgi:hypothetical protein
MMVALFFGGLIVIWLLWNAYIFWRIRQDYHAELAEFTELLEMDANDENVVLGLNGQNGKAHIEMRRERQ